MKTILIIEDNYELREELVHLLQLEGHLVTEADNGTIGLQKTKSENIDLILCDLMMPGISGLEVLKESKSKTETALIPFIIITALSERSVIRSAMELGADDYLTKPFTNQELIKTINAQLYKVDKINNKIKLLHENIIYSIPHELRTPLNGILGFSTIIKDSAEKLEVEDLVTIADSIVKSGNRLYSIIQKYLIYIYLNSKPDPQYFQNIFITHQYITGIINNLAKHYNREVDCFLVISSFAVNVIGKEELLFFVFHELIDNAFKFSVPGEKVDIQLLFNNNKMEVLIEDQGRGFPNGSINRINAFEQFNRKELGQQGIGLGLFLAKEIVHLLQGSIEISSQKDNGTSVLLQIPVS